MIIICLEWSRETVACVIWPGTKYQSTTQIPLCFQYIIRIVSFCKVKHFAKWEQIPLTSALPDCVWKTMKNWPNLEYFLWIWQGVNLLLGIIFIFYFFLLYIGIMYSNMNILFLKINFCLITWSWKLSKYDFWQQREGGVSQFLHFPTRGEGVFRHTCKMSLFYMTSFFWLKIVILKSSRFWQHQICDNAA